MLAPSEPLTTALHVTHKGFAWLAILSRLLALLSGRREGRIGFLFRSRGITTEDRDVSTAQFLLGDDVLAFG